MKLYEDFPLSKHAGEVEEFPEERRMMTDRKVGEEFKQVANHFTERLHIIIDYIYEGGTMQPGQMHHYLQEVEQALVNMAHDVMKLEHEMRYVEEEDFLNPPESAEIVEFPGGD